MDSIEMVSKISLALPEASVRRGVFKFTHLGPLAAAGQLSGKSIKRMARGVSHLRAQAMAGKVGPPAPSSGCWMFTRAGASQFPAGSNDTHENEHFLMNCPLRLLVARRSDDAFGRNPHSGLFRRTLRPNATPDRVALKRCSAEQFNGYRLVHNSMNSARIQTSYRILFQKKNRFFQRKLRYFLN